MLSPLSLARDSARALRIVVWLASVVLASSALSTSAQDVPAEEPALASEAPAQSSATSEVSPAAVARAQSVLGERERALHAELGKHSMILPGLALGVGVPLALTTVPIGALLLANAGGDSDAGAAHERRVGAGLLVAGAVGLAGIIYGAVQVHRGRRQRRLMEYELQSIAVQRLLLASGVLAAAPEARAVPPALRSPAAQRGERLMTTRGRTMITGGVDVGYDSRIRIVDLRFTPGFAFFVRDRLAVGAFLDVSRSEDNSFVRSRVMTFGGGFRLIYELGLGPHLGWWIWPYVGYAWRRSETRSLAFCPPTVCPFSAPQHTTAHVFRLGVLLPFMFHLTDSWAIGAGPRFEYDFSTSNGFTTGVASQLSGSF